MIYLIKSLRKFKAPNQFHLFILIFIYLFIIYAPNLEKIACENRSIIYRRFYYEELAIFTCVLFYVTVRLRHYSHPTFHLYAFSMRKRCHISFNFSKFTTKLQIIPLNNMSL